MSKKEEKTLQRKPTAEIKPALEKSLEKKPTTEIKPALEKTQEKSLEKKPTTEIKPALEKIQEKKSTSDIKPALEKTLEKTLEKKPVMEKIVEKKTTSEMKLVLEKTLEKSTSELSVTEKKGQIEKNDRKIEEKKGKDEIKEKKRKRSASDSASSQKSVKKPKKRKESSSSSSSSSSASSSPSSSSSSSEDRKTKKKRKSSPKKEKTDFAIGLPSSTVGTILVCGTGAMGQLGLGDVEEKKFPVPIPTLKNIEFCSMESAYLQNALILKNDKGETEVYTWGCNDETAAHVLGRDGTESLPEPVEALKGKNIVQVSVGQYHMAALDTKGKFYFWGSFKADEFLGPNIHKTSKDFIFYPELHPDVLDKTVVSIGCGGNSTAFITHKGELYEFGWTRRIERVTRDKLTRMLLTPRLLSSPGGFRKAVKVICGQVHSLCLFEKRDGRTVLTSWGSNRHGQLGHGDCNIRERPTIIKEFDREVIKFSCGDFHNLALTDDHQVYAWGRNSYGQCGQADTGKDFTKPVKVQFKDLPEGDYIDEIECGSNHSVAISKEGLVFTWGFGNEYQLGHNEEEDVVETPTQIKSKGVTQVMRVFKAYAGSSHTVFFSVNRKPEN